MPATWKVELHGLIEAQKKAMQVARDLHGSPMVDAIRRATLLVMGTARREAKVDRGLYRASITPTVEMQGQDVVGIVGSNLAYAPFVVLDTKPHWPPLEAIIAWVHRKKLTGQYSIKTRQRKHMAITQYLEDRALAWVIARSIARHGTKGDKSLITGYVRNMNQIRELVNQAVSRIVER